jgi:putative ABC transport system ATP-binding protein
MIAIEALRFRWQPSGPLVLDLPTLVVEPGQHLFIGGPSGSGKSTLLSLLAAVTVAQPGSVRVMDTDLAGLGQAARDHFRAHHIGYIFQLFNLIPYLSVVDNVLLPCRFSRIRRERATQRSNDLREEALRLLGHLDLTDPGLLEQPVTTLSVGQQQRVAAARALIGAPELVIADEPTSALDDDRRAAFIRLLFEECATTGSTLVFVSHDRSLAGLFGHSIDLGRLNRAGAGAP